MRHMLIAAVLAFTATALLTASASADVIIRGPFGGLIVVAPSPVDVRVGPGVFVGVPPRKTISSPEPVRPAADNEVLPLPNVLPGGNAPALAVGKQTQPIAPREFANTFKAGPGSYDVRFLHPIANQPVDVKFELPPGNPRVSYDNNTLRFDYGPRAVVIRFQPGGKVSVASR
jgi:hypothetical protein